MKELGKEAVKLEKKRAEAIEEAHVEVEKASDKEAKTAAKEVAKALAAAELKSEALINKTSSAIATQAKKLMVGSNKNNINGTLTKLKLAQKQQERILREMKKDAIKETEKRAMDVIHASGDWAGIMAQNSIGETMRSAREADFALAAQVEDIRRKAAMNAATASEAAYESVKVAKQAKAAAAVMTYKEALTATKWAQEAEKVVLDMEQTVMKAKLATETTLTVAKQDAIAGAKALATAKKSVEIAKLALKTAKSNAKRLQALKQRVDVINKQATEAKGAGKTAQKAVR